MTADATTTPNADQVAYWNGDNGTKWARLQARLDALFVPISEAAVAAAAAKPGEAVLDIGCGLRCDGAGAGGGSRPGRLGHRRRHLCTDARGGAPPPDRGRRGPCRRGAGRRRDRTLPGRHRRPRLLALRRDVLRRAGRGLHQHPAGAEARWPPCSSPAGGRSRAIPGSMCPTRPRCRICPNRRNRTPRRPGPSPSPNLRGSSGSSVWPVFPRSTSSLSTRC